MYIGPKKNCCLILYSNRMTLAELRESDKRALERFLHRERARRLCIIDGSCRRIRSSNDISEGDGIPDGLWEDS